MPHHTVPRHTVSRHATPRSTAPRRAVPRRVTPRRAVPHRKRQPGMIHHCCVVNAPETWRRGASSWICVGAWGVAVPDAWAHNDALLNLPICIGQQQIIVLEKATITWHCHIQKGGTTADRLRSCSKSGASQTGGAHTSHWFGKPHHHHSDVQ